MLSTRLRRTCRHAPCQYEHHTANTFHILTSWSIFVAVWDCHELSKCDHSCVPCWWCVSNVFLSGPQDTGKRSAIDADREDARLRRLAAEVAAQQERERQWRVARGTATAEDLQGPIRSGPAERDTWMTELPEARRPNAQPSQVNVVSARLLITICLFMLNTNLV